MIKAVVFDLDGTVAYTLPEIMRAVNLTMRQYGFPERTSEEVRLAIGRGGRRLISDSLPESASHDEALLNEAYKTYGTIYREIFIETKTVYPGIPEAMHTLHEKYGMKIGILSNKGDELTQKLVKNILPAGLCDAAQGVVAGVPKKPAVEMTNLLLKQLGVQSEETAMVGDSDVDFQTALNAGMKHVGVTWGYRDRSFLEACHIPILVDRAEELPDVIANL